VRLGVALGWHVHPWEDLLALVRRAEALGYAAVYVDGDVSMLDARAERDVLDGWTVTAALLAKTERVEIGSMRLAHHWNAARLAQAVATAERIWPGRLRLLVSGGDRPIDARFGLPLPAPGERVRMLDELLGTLRALWRGETVTRVGRYVRLDGARVRPVPPGGIPIEVAARGPRMLRVVAAHADVWNVNLPPIAARVGRAAAQLDAACRLRGRDPGTIRRSLWIFARLGGDRSAALAEYRRLNPWFRDLPDAEILPVLVLGGALECRERLARLTQELRLDLPVADLSGLAAGPAAELLEALAEAEFLR
jgi:alkanesulfonate monooxygenase SsuD/methylene tetrahydromethanopterin reductase-like flavin-dependent oxidoreductase (luciferase family)